MGFAKGFVDNCKTTNPKYVIHQLLFAKRSFFRNALGRHLKSMLEQDISMVNATK
jgi:hypothetical protein